MLVEYVAALPEVNFPACGRLTRSVGLLLEATGPRLPVGALALVKDRGNQVACEVVGFQDERLLLLAIDESRQLSPTSQVAPLHLTFKAGPWLPGRVLDGLGRPLDGRPLPSDGEEIELDPPSLDPMARGTSADCNVIALIGERGREAREFLEDTLGPAGLARSVVVVVTSDKPAPMRLKGAFLATAIAAYLRRQGRNVLLLMDSLTRVAMAQREIGLASGEPPTARGYPPSVFAIIPRLVEQAGTLGEHGSITGIYTVLLHEENDPVGELAKSVLDGHITLSRELAGRAHYPAIDVLNSVSRVAHRVTTAEHARNRTRFVELYARWRDAEELISLGTYNPGADLRADEAVAAHGKLHAFLKQGIAEQFSLTQSIAQLAEAIQ